MFYSILLFSDSFLQLLLNGDIWQNVTCSACGEYQACQCGPILTEQNTPHRPAVVPASPITGPRARLKALWDLRLETGDWAEQAKLSLAVNLGSKWQVGGQWRGEVCVPTGSSGTDLVSGPSAWTSPVSDPRQLRYQQDRALLGGLGGAPIFTAWAGLEWADTTMSQERRRSWFASWDASQTTFRVSLEYIFSSDVGC